MILNIFALVKQKNTPDDTGDIKKHQKPQKPEFNIQAFVVSTTIKEEGLYKA